MIPTLFFYMETIESSSPKEDNWVWWDIQTIELFNAYLNITHIAINWKYFDPKNIITSDNINTTIFDTHIETTYGLSDPNSLDMSDTAVIREVEKMTYITTPLKNTITDPIVKNNIIKNIGRFIEEHARKWNHWCFVIVTCYENDDSAIRLDLYCLPKRRSWDNLDYAHIRHKILPIISLKPKEKWIPDQVHWIVSCSSTYSS